MQSKASTIKQYLSELSEDRQKAISELRRVILANLPAGFTETISYGMIGYVVPHSLYPAGYHCDPKLPLPFMNIGSQKNFIAVYHMGIYADHDLLDWFTSEFPKHSNYKLDMGKSCIRFKKPDQIPFSLIGQLAGKITPQGWIALYEKSFRKAE